MLQYHQHSYKFLRGHNTIHVIAKPVVNSPSLRNTLLYTVPFTSSGNQSPLNVVVGFYSKELAQGYIHEMCLDAIPMENSLDRWKDVSTMMGIPLVVVVNEYSVIDDKTLHAELFFYHKTLDTSPTHLKKFLSDFN